MNEAIKPVVGGRYNWRNQPERLVYMGMCEPRNGRWHQFALVEKPTEVWCEVLPGDLHMLEETKDEPPSKPDEQPRANRLNYVAIAQALDAKERPLAAGIDDGYEQGFELSTGMSYDDADSQWAYDVGTYIGACLAVREKALPRPERASADKAQATLDLKVGDRVRYLHWGALTEDVISRIGDSGIVFMQSGHWKFPQSVEKLP